MYVYLLCATNMLIYHLNKLFFSSNEFYMEQSIIWSLTFQADIVSSVYIQVYLELFHSSLWKVCLPALGRRSK